MLDNLSSPRECGACSLCCKLPSISEDDAPGIAKPAGEWCKHCRPGLGGCSIYNSRPQLCQEFLCNWRLGYLGDHWAPLKSGMLLWNAQEGIHVLVDVGAHGRWREEPYYADLLSFARNIRPMHKLVSIAQHEGSCRITYAAIDPLGFVLDLPDGYVPFTLMAEFPLMRIRVEHVSAFEEHAAWISDPLLKLREAARSAADMNAGLAMQRVIERLEDRGWALDSTGEEITRICET